MLKDGMSLPWVWFPVYSNITCIGKGVKIKPTNHPRQNDTLEVNPSYVIASLSLTYTRLVF